MEWIEWMGVFILLFLFWALWKENRKLRREIEALVSEKQGLSVKYGKTLEQFLPFMKNYPYRKERFRFLGNPIDGIQFEENEIIFVEFKTGKSKLSEAQKKIKELVENGRVRFKEIKI